MLAAAILLVSPLCMAARADEDAAEPTLTVGYIDYPGFINQNAGGEYTGYAVEYLNKISEYTGFRYEYVYGSWPDLMERLKNGGNRPAVQCPVYKRAG